MQPNYKEASVEKPSKPFEEGFREENMANEQGGYVTIIDLDNRNYKQAVVVDQDLDDDVNSSILVVGQGEKAPGGRAHSKRKFGSIHQHFRVISHFKATVDVALSALAFDPTGTLLAAASERGKCTLLFRHSH